MVALITESILQMENHLLLDVNYAVLWLKIKIKYKRKIKLKKSNKKKFKSFKKLHNKSYLKILFDKNLVVEIVLTFLKK
jgi:hypothetical protein